ncbi:hypothetical protein OKW96_11830 [Sphingobacterium sp. KU25419]|nr:hypothetical protein OKW96_11830 [Sphingobacterium sp. KU25419]
MDKRKESDVKLDSVFTSLKSLFSDGSINTISSLIDYSPSKLAKLLKMSYNTFLIKIHSPWKFSNEHILLLAYTIGIDPNIILNIIQKESEEHINNEFKKYLEKIKKRKLVEKLKNS